MASRLHRLIRIIRILRRKAYPNVQSLCQLLQVKERTIFNDLKELKEELGVEVLFDKSRKGYFLGTDDLELGFCALSEDTSFLLLAACKLFSLHCGKDLAEPLEELFAEEIRRCLSLSAESLQGLIKTEESSEENGMPNMALDDFLRICRACAGSKPLKIRLSDKGYGEGNSCKDGHRILHVKPRQIVLGKEAWRIVFSDGNSSAENGLSADELSLDLRQISELD